jgi:hypothetical protein
LYILVMGFKELFTLLLFLTNLIMKINKKRLKILSFYIISISLWKKKYHWWNFNILYTKNHILLAMCIFTLIYRHDNLSNRTVFTCVYAWYLLHNRVGWSIAQLMWQHNHHKECACTIVHCILRLLDVNFWSIAPNLRKWTHLWFLNPSFHEKCWTRLWLMNLCFIHKTLQ